MDNVHATVFTVGDLVSLQHIAYGAGAIRCVGIVMQALDAHEHEARYNVWVEVNGVGQLIGPLFEYEMELVKNAIE